MTNTYEYNEPENPNQSNELVRLHYFKERSVIGIM